ncbi:hypothetical protein E05_36370 [Plautia stali symbiont]|nr:hypothetical protein E05_36370 [Plautia stali symbiont]
MWRGGHGGRQIEAKQKTHKRCMVRGDPLLHAEKIVGLSADAGLFVQLTLRCFQQRFIGLKMAGRLIPGNAAVDALFHHQ